MKGERCCAGALERQHSAACLRCKESERGGKRPVAQGRFAVFQGLIARRSTPARSANVRLTCGRSRRSLERRSYAVWLAKDGLSVDALDCWTRKPCAVLRDGAWRASSTSYGIQTGREIRVLAKRCIQLPNV